MFELDNNYKKFLFSIGSIIIISAVGYRIATSEKIDFETFLFKIKAEN